MEDSIISIPDSETSVAMNSTFSPQKPTLTPKKEMDSTINTTFTPDDKKTANDVTATPIDTTFSPVKDEAVDQKPEDKEVKPKALPPSRAITRARSKTPVRDNSAIFMLESPERSAVPEIVIVPPSTERKRVRNANKTPTRVAMTPTRRSTRHTPLKTVQEIPCTKEATPTVTVAAQASVAPPQAEVRAPMVQSPVILKSIRKRSMSVTDIDPPMKRNFRVQFHSPANMERTITEIDESLHLNYSKTFPTSANTDEPPVFKQPARRKRSLSNAETPVDKLATQQLLDEKKKGPRTGPSPSPRRKMPNFAAIHQSIFQQMESLDDFTERKKERAQALLSGSIGPLFSGGSTGGGNIIKPVNRGAIGKANLSKKQASNLMKPKRGINKRPQQQSTAMKITDNKLKAIIANSDFTIPAEEEEEKEDKNYFVEELKGEDEERKPLVEPPKEIVEQVDGIKSEDQIVELHPPVVADVATKENLNAVANKASKIKEPKIIAKDWNIKPKSTNLNVSSNRLKNRLVVSSLAKAKITTAPPRSQPTSAVTVAPKDLNETAQLNSSTYTLVRGVRTNRHFELLMKHRNNKLTAKK